MNIRRANEQDYPQIIELIREFASFQQMNSKMINSVDKMIQEKDYFNCFIAINSDKEVVGYSTYFFTYHTWIGKSIYMDDLYVQEKYRKNGIGKRLLDSIIDIGKHEKCEKLRWQVSDWNTNAQEFYKSIGAQIDNCEYNCDLYLKN